MTKKYFSFTSLNGVVCPLTQRQIYIIWHMYGLLSLSLFLSSQYILCIANPKTVAMTFLVDGTISFFGADWPGKFHFDCFFHFWGVVVNPSFVYGRETTQKLLRITFEHDQLPRSSQVGSVFVPP